jgi:hypothetical protein
MKRAKAIGMATRACSNGAVPSTLDAAVTMGGEAVVLDGCNELLLEVVLVLVVAVTKFAQVILVLLEKWMTKLRSGMEASEPTFMEPNSSWNVAS